MSDYLDLNNEELLKDFFSEAEQQVQSLESNILVIEHDPENHEAIDEIFRAAHTLKGGSATVEMHELSGFTHLVEDLLDSIRNRDVKITAPVVDVLLRSLDIIKEMLSARSAGTVSNENTDDLKQTIQSLIPQKGKKISQKPKSQSTPVKATPRSFPIQDTGSTIGSLSEYELLELKEAVLPGQTVQVVTVIFDESNPMNSVGGIQVFATLKSYGQILKTIPDFDSLYEDVFQEKVVYFVATTDSAEQIACGAKISDVTLDVQVEAFNFASSFSQPLGTKKIPSSSMPPLITVSEVAHTDDLADSDSEDPTSGDEHPSANTRGASVKKTSSGHSSGSVLRVDSRRIDYLLNLVSETVITKASFNQSALHFTELFNQFQQSETLYKDKLRKLLDHIPDYLEELQDGVSSKDVKKRLNSESAEILNIFNGFESNMKTIVNKFRSSAQNLGRITGELQEGVMKIRMVPISQIFSRFPRLVRDLSHDLEKKIQLIIDGEDTELDKSVVEDLLDPLMHCVRNALDHGIEVPDVRRSAGKSEEGTIILKASNEGSMIVIEIADDGKGIDVEAVRQRAISRGIIHPGKTLTDVEAFQLIFEPGFSTAEKVTNVSGRGVGLDVVRTHIEKLNGTVTINSQPGAGSRFTIRLPLTLAIIQGLLVRVGDEVYSIPITSVIESHRVTSEDISRIDNYEVFNVRDEVISLLRLNRLFGLKAVENGDYSYIVIVGTSEKKVGLMVGSLIGEEDVVIKPLRDQFTVSPGIAGASILGDGSVSLIIDVSQLLELGLKQEIQARERREASVW